jgi:type VI secretion system secreted protein VgrG
VRFHWDRKDTPGEKSTCWIRISQTGGLGNVILPRVGHEVLVDFLNGDPDRPLVVGRVFNRSHMPIYDLPANKTRALWRTLRYGETGQYPDTRPLDTGAPGANEIRFEDKGGQEEMFIHAERDMNARVRFNETHHVGHNQDHLAGYDRTAEVGHDETTKIGNNQTLTVTQKRDATIGQSDHLKVGTTLLVEAKTSITLRVGKSSIVIDGMGVTIHAPNVTLQADVAAEMHGGTTTDVTAKTTLTLKGGLTRIN